MPPHSSEYANEVSSNLPTLANRTQPHKFCPRDPGPLLKGTHSFLPTPIKLNQSFKAVPGSVFFAGALTSDQDPACTHPCPSKPLSFQSSPVCKGPGYPKGEKQTQASREGQQEGTSNTVVLATSPALPVSERKLWVHRPWDLTRINLGRRPISQTQMDALVRLQSNSKELWTFLNGFFFCSGFSWFSAQGCTANLFYDLLSAPGRMDSLSLPKALISLPLLFLKLLILPHICIQAKTAFPTTTLHLAFKWNHCSISEVP